MEKDVVVNGKGFRTRDIFLKEMDELFESEEELFYEYTTLKGASKNLFDTQLEELKKLNLQKASNAKERGELSAKKGEALERLVEILINGTAILETVCNVGTATNEVDLVISTSFKGESLKSLLIEKGVDIKSLISNSPGIIGFDDYFLAECKNYNKNVPATWVGKFYTLMQVCGKCNVGIIFSNKGLTGKKTSWTDAHGLTKILRCISENKSSIIDFNINDFERISRGENFFKILNSKMLELAIGADFSKYQIPHKNKDELDMKFREL